MVLWNIEPEPELFEVFSKRTWSPRICSSRSAQPSAPGPAGSLYTSIRHIRICFNIPKPDNIPLTIPRPIHLYFVPGRAFCPDLNPGFVPATLKSARPHSLYLHPLHSGIYIFPPRSSTLLPLQPPPTRQDCRIHQTDYKLQYGAQTVPYAATASSAVYGDEGEFA